MGKKANNHAPRKTGEATKQNVDAGGDI